MKTLHLTNYYHPNSGGISTSFNNLMEAAERHERFVTLVVPGAKEDVEVINPFAKIYYVPAKYSPVFDKRYRIIMPWQYLPNDSIIRKILLAEEPDLIEVTDKYSLSMIGPMIRLNKFKQLGRPPLVHFSCERMDDNVGAFISSGRLGNWLARRFISNYTLPNFDYHIANSTYTAEEFLSSLSPEVNPGRSRAMINWCWRKFRAPRVPIKHRIFVSPRGVNLSYFSPTRASNELRDEIRERVGIPKNSVVLLYAGRVSPEKNIGLLVEMMKQLAADTDRDFRLLVAGGGPKEDWLASETLDHFPGKTVMLGHLDKETLADLYANCDVFIHPNPKEPFGIGPLEAMASGVPTVAPNAGGILSYATNENIWLAEPTGTSFAGAVRSVLADNTVRAKKIENAFETAQANTCDQATDRQFAIYDKIFDDFHARRELFTDNDMAKEFDFVSVLLSDELTERDLNRVEIPSERAKAQKPD